jgi:AcrR family transcriptional regulator
MQNPEPISERGPASSLPTKTRILLAAESLFAERSVEAVSFREIATAAGQQNTNAVQYHFKTKDRLVQAIFLLRVGQMIGRRARMLAEAERLGLLEDLPTLLRIVFLPQFDLVDEQGRHSYAGFLSQYVARYMPAGILHAVDTEIPETNTIRRLLALLRQRLRHLPDPIYARRVGMTTQVFAYTVVHWDNERRTGATPRVPLAQLIDDALDAAVALLSAPYRSRAASLLTSEDWSYGG